MSYVGTVSSECCRYKRDDGIDMTATLYLPPGYDKDRDGRLPCIIWAYPKEFKSKDAAGQPSPPLLSAFLITTLNSIPNSLMLPQSTPIQPIALHPGERYSLSTNSLDFKPLQRTPNHSNQLQRSPNHPNQVQTTNIFKSPQTASNHFKQLQTVPDHFKSLQTTPHHKLSSSRATSLNK